MSMRETVEITCPKCGRKSPFGIWSSINTVLDPEMKELVRNEEAFMFTCPACGDRNTVVYGFLYHQMEDRLMIHFANSEENFREVCEYLLNPPKGDNENLNELLDMSREGYINRIVRTRNELLEKLSIFDAGLDDRVIEICKLFSYTKLSEEIKSELEYALFYVDEEGKRLIEFKFEEQLAKVELQEEMYEAIDEMFKDFWPKELSQNIVIDMGWALDIVKSRMVN